MPKRLELTNQRFGRLLVLEKSTTRKCNKISWICLCDCGTTKVIQGVSLTAGKSESCGCQTVENTKKTNKTRIRKKKSDLELGRNQYYSSYRYQAVRRNLSFDITKEFFLELIQQNCYYCNAEPRKMTGFSGGSVYFNGVDRKDNNQGYFIENCVPCCSICNHAKKEMSHDDFILWISRAYRFIIKI